MKNYQIVFSPTGGTEKVANAITKNWSPVETIRAYEDTLVQIEDYAQNSGFQVIAAISVVAEHSIITSMRLEDLI